MKASSTMWCVWRKSMARCSRSTTSKSKTRMTARPICNAWRRCKNWSQRERSVRPASGMLRTWSPSALTGTCTTHCCRWRTRMLCRSSCARWLSMHPAKWNSCVILKPSTTLRLVRKLLASAACTCCATPIVRKKGWGLRWLATSTPTSYSGWSMTRPVSSG
ncbi:hypothetical protein D3C76_906910 [compost metagenome]